MSGFAATMAGFSGKTTERILSVKRVVAIKLFGAVIEDTPVLTGRLRGNWQTSLGTAKEGELQVRSGAEAMGEVVSIASAIKGDETVFLRNNLPYANRIEFEGWSHEKAPQGMVRKNALLFQKNIQDAVNGGLL